MTFRQLLAALWRQRLVVVVLFATTVGATYGYLQTLSPTYTATASVGVVPTNDSASVSDFNGLVSLLLPTLGEISTSSNTLSDAVRRIPDPPTVSQLRGKVTATTVQNTLVLRIAVTDGDPERAALLANAVAAALPGNDPTGGLVALKIVDAANAPSTPTAPKPTLILGLGVVLGLGLAVAGALVRDASRRTLGDMEELARVTGGPVLARLPRRRSEQVVTAADPTSVAGYRSLRISLEVAAARAPLPAVVVAGLEPGTSTGWIAGNLALAMAQVQDRVLLVHADPGSTALADFAAVPEGAPEPLPGLTEVLMDRQRAGEPGPDPAPDPAAKLVLPGIVEGLFVLPLGLASDDLPALLETRFNALLRGLAEHYDVVVVEASPVLANDDARVMAAGGGILLVADPSDSSPRRVREALGNLDVVGARLLGTVALVDDAEARGRR